MSKREEKAMEREIEWVKIAGREIPAFKVICPECNALDLRTDFNTKTVPWIATCQQGHRFEVNPDANA